MTFGLTEQGLLTPRLQDLLEQWRAVFRGLFGPSIDFSSESVEGQAIAIVSEREALRWELLEILHGALDPSKATGALLDALCALTLTFRRGPTFSVVELLLAGDNGTTVPAGSLASNGQPEFQFQTLEDVELATTSAWQSLTAYDAGDVVTLGGNVYIAKNAGTSQADIVDPEVTSPPVHTTRDDEDIVPDNDIHWRWIGTGSAIAYVNARAVIAGPTFVAATGIHTIDTPVSGWGGVINPADVTPGANTQSDEDLRLTREAELAALGTSPPDALRGRLLRVGESGDRSVGVSQRHRHDRRRRHSAARDRGAGSRRRRAGDP
jgi:hypothetical protein